MWTVPDIRSKPDPLVSLSWLAYDALTLGLLGLESHRLSPSLNSEPLPFKLEGRLQREPCRRCVYAMAAGGNLLRMA